LIFLCVLCASSEAGGEPIKTKIVYSSKGLFKRGVLTGGTLNNAESTNRIEPPGIISYETIDTVIDRLSETLVEMVKEYGVN
jgi:acetylornithine/succinyldiaminopimelate/putrescine aminotransferase